MKKDDILRSIIEKELYLIGTPEEVEKSIVKYNGKVKIQAFLTDLKDEVVLQKFEKYNIVTKMYNEGVSKDSFIIICSKYDFSKWSSYLMLEELKEYENYISEVLLSSILYKKKFITLMGSKFLKQIVDVMSENDEFKNEYEWHWFRDSDFWTDIKKEYLHVANMSDVLIESSSDKEDNKLYQISKSSLKNKTIKLTVSDYGFFAHFPQLEKDREINNKILLRERERYDGIYYDGLFGATVDKIVEDIVSKDFSMNPDEISKKIDLLINEDYLSKSEVLELCNDEIKRWENCESYDKNDIVFAKYIKENIGETGLMLNPNEAGINLVLYGVEQIFKVIGIEWENIPIKRLEKIILDNRETDSLIYPCVRKALGISEFREKYKIITYKSIQYFDIIDYMKYTFVYYSKVKDFCVFTGLDNANDKVWYNLTSFEQYKIMLKDAKKRFRGGFSNIYYLPEQIKRYIKFGRIEFLENCNGLFLLVDEDKYYRLSMMTLNPGEFRLPNLKKPVLIKNVYKSNTENEKYEYVIKWLKKQGFISDSTFVQIQGNPRTMLKDLSFIEKRKQSLEKMGFYIGSPTIDMLREIDILSYNADFLNYYQFDYRSDEERINLINEGGYIIVKDKNNKLCGVSLAEVSNGIADGLEIVVAPEYKMQGIAPILSYERYKWLDKIGIEVIRSYVRIDNERSKKYHINLGFEYRDVFVDYWIKNK